MKKITQKELVSISTIVIEAQNRISQICQNIVIEIGFKDEIEDDISQITNMIYINFQLPRNDKSRKQIYLFPRMAIMYYLRYYENISWQKIGKVFGDKDHSTIMHSVATARIYIETNQFEIKELVEKIKFYIKSKS